MCEQSRCVPMVGGLTADTTKPLSTEEVHFSTRGPVLTADILKMRPIIGKILNPADTT